MMNGMKFDNPQTAAQSKVLSVCHVIKHMLRKMKSKQTDPKLLAEVTNLTVLVICRKG